MYISLLITYCSFFSTFPKECMNTVQFISTTPVFSEILCRNIGADDVIVAESIVAPEISLHSFWEEDVQVRVLYLLYVRTGVTNFSIGPLQMKPSFAEQIENIVRNDVSLKRKYKKLIIYGHDIHKARRIRIERLCSLSWQLEYLSAFMQIATKRLKGKVKNYNMRVKYLATMYNSGLFVNINDIEKIFKTKRFPHWGIEKFNYAECALEFYEKLKSKCTPE